MTFTPRPPKGAVHAEVERGDEEICGGMRFGGVGGGNGAASEGDRLGRGYDWTVPQECGGICLCGFEEGADDEVVSGAGAADAAGAVQAVRKVFGRGGNRYEHAGGRTGVGIGAGSRVEQRYGGGKRGGDRKAGERRKCWGSAGGGQHRVSGSGI